MPIKVPASPVIIHLWDFGGSVLGTRKEVTLKSEEGLPLTSQNSVVLD